MDWLNLTPRSNIVSSIIRKILTTPQCQLTYQPVFRSPINAVLRAHHIAFLPPTSYPAARTPRLALLAAKTTLRTRRSLH
jgi:hypothetical protein